MRRFRLCSFFFVPGSAQNWDRLDVSMDDVNDKGHGRDWAELRTEVKGEDVCW